MGRNSRAKRDRHFESTRAPISAPPHEKHNLLIWFRSVGFASIVLGGIGLIQTFFWPSVCLVFFGFVILFVDLLLEELRNHSWLKIVLLLTFICGAVAFGKAVIFRRDPIDAVAMLLRDSEGNRYVKMIIWNETDTDYEDVDVTVRTYPRKPNMITSARQESTLSDVIFYPAIPGTLNPLKDDNDSFGGPVDPRTGTFADLGKLETNFQRVRCEKLPSDSPLVIDLSLLSGSAPKRISIRGKYRGPFRFRNYSKTIDVWDGLSR